MAKTEVDTGSTPPESASALAEGLARLRDMVERSDVEGARAYVKELEQLWPESDKVQHWARVLAPPVARAAKGAPNQSFEREYSWLEQHAHEYPGCWLAVVGDQLIAADPSPGAVIRKIQKSPEAEGALLFFQPSLPH